MTPTRDAEAREHLHALVDHLPEKELPHARRVLEALRALGDPMRTALREAPEEEEPISEEERAALEEAEEAVGRGDVTTLEAFLGDSED